MLTAPKLEALLASRGLNSQQILELVTHRLDVRDDCPVYISGSLVDGLGNRRSDIDVFVISDGTTQDADSFPADIVECGSTFADIETWSEQDISRLSKQIERLSDPSADFRLSC